MKISVFCPTRGRKKLLPRGIDSLLNNASDKSNMEFIFRFDVDDISTLKYIMKYYNAEKTSTETINRTFTWGSSRFKVINTFSKKHKVSMKFIYGKRHGYNLINKYNDEAMYISDGEYLVHWTDDFVLLDNDVKLKWDDVIREGKNQNFVFFFPLNPKWNPIQPVAFPRKFYEINNRCCPNVLDDWWYLELCKILPPDVPVIMDDWKVDHRAVWQTSNQDSTSSEGRCEWDSSRENNVVGYEYYNLEEMENIKKYLEENPNTKKTTQRHDEKISKLNFERGGGSGRWKR